MMKNPDMFKFPAGIVSGELEGLRQENAELKERNERLCLFIRSLVHDMKTPLTPLLGASELLASAVTVKPWTDFARSIQMSAEGLLRIVDELLDLEKCERGLLELDCADVDAAALLYEAADGYRDAAVTGRLDFGVEVPPLPPVRADGARLKQVVNTLLFNAIRYTPDGGKVFLIAELEHDRLRVSIVDTGLSIDGDESKDIFQEYPAQSLKKSRAGSNGLALARRLVELHGGEINAFSGADKNNVFRFNIPIAGPRRIGMGAI